MNKVKAITAIALVTFLSCSAKTADQNAIYKTGKGTLQEKQAAIITGTKVSKTGKQLGYEFDNSANTMKIFFNKDTALLKGEQMASGIKYSNKVYTYTEWQGNSTLFKNGVKVFEAIKSK